MKISPQLINAIDTMLTELSRLIAVEREKDPQFNNFANCGSVYFDSGKHNLKEKKPEKEGHQTAQKILLAYWNIFACVKAAIPILERSKNSLDGKFTLGDYVKTCGNAFKFLGNVDDTNIFAFPKGYAKDSLQQAIHTALYQCLVTITQIPNEEIQESLDTLPMSSMGNLKKLLGILPGVPKEAQDYVTKEGITEKTYEFLNNLKTDMLTTYAMNLSDYDVSQALNEAEAQDARSTRTQALRYQLRNAPFRPANDFTADYQRSTRLKEAFERKYSLKLEKNKYVRRWLASVRDKLDAGEALERESDATRAEQQDFLQTEFAKIKQEGSLAVPFHLVARMVGDEVDSSASNQIGRLRKLNASFALRQYYNDIHAIQNNLRVTAWCRFLELDAALQQSRQNAEDQGSALEAAYNEVRAILLEQYEAQSAFNSEAFPAQGTLQEKFNRLMVGYQEAAKEFLWRAQETTQQGNQTKPEWVRSQIGRMLDTLEADELPYCKPLHELLTAERLAAVQAELDTLCTEREVILARELTEADPAAVKAHYQFVSELTHKILTTQYHRDAIQSRLEWRDHEGRPFLEVMRGIDEILTGKYTGKYTRLQAHIEAACTISNLAQAIEAIEVAETYCRKAFGENFEGRCTQDSEQLAEEFQSIFPIVADVHAEKIRHLGIIRDAFYSYRSLLARKSQILSDQAELAEEVTVVPPKPAAGPATTTTATATTTAVTQLSQSANDILVVSPATLSTSAVAQQATEQFIQAKKAVLVKGPRSRSAPQDLSSDNIVVVSSELDDDDTGMDPQEATQRRLTVAKENVDQARKALDEHEKSRQASDLRYPRIKEEHRQAVLRQKQLASAYERNLRVQKQSLVEINALKNLTQKLEDKTYLQGEQFCQLFPLIQPYLKEGETLENIKTELLQMVGRWFGTGKRHEIKEAIISAISKRQKHIERQRVREILEELEPLGKKVISLGQEVQAMESEAKAYEVRYHEQARGYAEQLAAHEQTVEAITAEIKEHTRMKLTDLIHSLEAQGAAIKVLNEMLAAIDFDSDSAEDDTEGSDPKELLETVRQRQGEITDRLGAIAANYSELPEAYLDEKCSADYLRALPEILSRLRGSQALCAEKEGQLQEIHMTYQAALGFSTDYLTKISQIVAGLETFALDLDGDLTEQTKKLQEWNTSASAAEEEYATALRTNPLPQCASSFLISKKYNQQLLSISEQVLRKCETLSGIPSMLEALKQEGLYREHYATLDARLATQTQGIEGLSVRLCALGGDAELNDQRQSFAIICQEIQALQQAFNTQLVIGYECQSGDFRRLSVSVAEKTREYDGKKTALKTQMDGVISLKDRINKSLAEQETTQAWLATLAKVLRTLGDLEGDVDLTVKDLAAPHRAVATFRTTNRDALEAYRARDPDADVFKNLHEIDRKLKQHRSTLVASINRDLDTYHDRREKKYRKKDFVRRAAWLIVGIFLSLTLVGLVYWFKSSFALDKTKRKNNSEKLKSQLKEYEDTGSPDSTKNILSAIEKSLKKFPSRKNKVAPMAQATGSVSPLEDRLQGAVQDPTYKWCLTNIRRRIDPAAAAQAGASKEPKRVMIIL